MNDTHKLLLAFIEASGFDVEKTEKDGVTYFNGYKNTLGGQVADYKTDVIVEYKVTKKEQAEDTTNNGLHWFLHEYKHKLKGGRMAFFEVDTEYPINSYADYKKQIANTNPVIADCQGNFPEVWINKPYTVQLSDSHGRVMFIKSVNKDQLF